MSTTDLWTRLEGWVPIEEHQTGDDKRAHVEAVQAWLDKWAEVTHQQDSDELYDDCHQQK